MNLVKIAKLYKNGEVSEEYAVKLIRSLSIPEMKYEDEENKHYSESYVDGDINNTLIAVQAQVPENLTPSEFGDFCKLYVKAVGNR